MAILPNNKHSHIWSHTVLCQNKSNWNIQLKFHLIQPLNRFLNPLPQTQYVAVNFIRAHHWSRILKLVVTFETIWNFFLLFTYHVIFSFESHKGSISWLPFKYLKTTIPYMSHFPLKEKFPFLIQNSLVFTILIIVFFF